MTIGNGSVELVQTDAGAIYDATISALESGVNEALYPGDERRIFGEAMASVLAQVVGTIQDAAQQTMLRFARGEVLDALGARLGVVRLRGTPASCVLRFSLSQAMDLAIEIPKWTKATVDGSVYFATDTAAIIEPGNTYVDVKASCTSEGTFGNGYGANSITTMVDLIPYVSRVTNTTVTAGGDDGEPYTTEGDDRYRERILIAPNRLSTAGPEQGYVYWAKTADANIVDVAAFSERETLERDLPVVSGKAYLGGDQLLPDTLVVGDGKTAATATYKDNLLTITLTGANPPSTIHVAVDRKMDGRVKVVPLMDGGKLPDADVLKAVYDTVNDRSVRPMTDVVTVEPPKAVPYSIELEYWTTPSDETACVATIEGAGGSIARYISEQSSILGRDINPDVLKTMCMQPMDQAGSVGAIRCEVVEPEYMEVSADEVAVWDEALIVKHHVETEARWS